MSLKATNPKGMVFLNRGNISREADLLLREFPDSSVAYLRKAIQERAEVFRGDGAAARVLVAELTRRLEAGKRYWA